MPLYEYKCTKCDWVGERFIKFINIERELNCELCGASLEKVVSIPSKGKVKQSRIREAQESGFDPEYVGSNPTATAKF